jgi:hypothetical protein
MIPNVVEKNISERNKKNRLNGRSLKKSKKKKKNRIK